MTRHILDAAYRLVRDYPGGSPSLAPRMGKSAHTLNHELTSQGTAKLGLLDAVTMSDFSGDLRILHEWATHAGQMLIPLPPQASSGNKALDACLSSVSRVAAEFSDVLRESTGVLADGAVSDNDMLRVRAEAGELLAAMHGLMAALAALNLAGKPCDKGGHSS